MKETDLKERYRVLVRELKEWKKSKGQKITNEEIAQKLGYDRTYFSSLLGERGNVTENHIEDFMLRFPTNTTSPNITEEPSGSYGQNNDLKTLIEANHMLAQSILIDARNRENLTAANMELTKKVTVGDQSQNEQDVKAMRSVFLELLGEVGSGKRYKSPDEVKAIYRKRIADALELTLKEDIQKNLDRKHTLK